MGEGGRRVREGKGEKGRDRGGSGVKDRVRVRRVGRREKRGGGGKGGAGGRRSDREWG